ncbi:flavin reductase [bacterium]|nr:flavin reductase [bacterium]
MNITKDIKYIGVNDHNIDLFESQYKVPNGVSYNSYIILDEKIAVIDTADANYTHEWLDNLQEALNGKKPDYLIVQHMEPDHSANILNFANLYKEAKIISSAKAFNMMSQFFKSDFEDRKIIITEGDTISLGKHTLSFVSAPMVHWPEVMVTYDSYEKVLFSADGFGKFGALDTKEEWIDEARRYYIGIVGKYGTQVQNLLKKASALEIEKICPAHGPVLTENLGYYLNLYNTWSSYQAETEGIMIAYNSVYGNTRKAIIKLEAKLKAKGCPEVAVFDLARCDMHDAIAKAFKYSKLIVATTTYNADIFPATRIFLEGLKERNYQNRTVALIENGTWAPNAKKVMQGIFEECKKITFAENTVTIKSALSEESTNQLEALTDELCRNYIAWDSKKANKNDLKALFNIGYGLYLVTSNDGKKDNGLIVNTISQVSISPDKIAVTINKDNYSHHVIKQTGKLNVNCLTTETPFSIFEKFGFQSGRTTNKFDGCTPLYSDNGLVFLPKYINSFMSLKVEKYVDLDSHGMFICSITESRVISDIETMTYSYYHANVKPKPQTEGKVGFVCKICGYIYEGETLPDDFVCPLCKHGASDFEPIAK